MTMKYSGAQRLKESTQFYSVFDQIDGHHPWMDAVASGFVAYRVRQLNSGNVVYFNFALAKEMGLISPDHPEHMNTILHEKILETFSIQIINEYDELTKRRIDPATIRPNKYMASRYLQMQHSNKQGKTSGDGRGIWNGTIRHQGITWDISSRGTGVTCLSPGSVEAKKPLKTGGTEFGYGCGLAEMDELLGAAILAEIMHLQGINTERVLCLIDLGRGHGIGVRAAPNLLRPAHLFMYLKQERYDELKAATDYLINRQVQNKSWSIPSNGSEKYNELLDVVCDSFAKFSAQLDTDYVFAWLDWDGDNVLADAGIIDYGSIRQFGLRHDKYRYDDIVRFSTSLNEQKTKARLTVQVFAQLTDYLITGNRKPLKVFSNHPTVAKFNNRFAGHKAERTLYRMGFDQVQRTRILKHKNLFARLEKDFSFLERAKIKGTTGKVADGVNHPALFNMRKALKYYAEYLNETKGPLNSRIVPEKTFFETILSGFAKSADNQMTESQKKHIWSFQKNYREMVAVAAGTCAPDAILPELVRRSKQLNADNRITGNALIEMVEEIITYKQKGMTSIEIQAIIDRLIFATGKVPEVTVSEYLSGKKETGPVKMDLLAKLFALIEQNKESI